LLTYKDANANENRMLQKTRSTQNGGYIALTNQTLFLQRGEELRRHGISELNSRGDCEQTRMKDDSAARQAWK